MIESKEFLRFAVCAHGFNTDDMLVREKMLYFHTFLEAAEKANELYNDGSYDEITIDYIEYKTLQYLVLEKED